jgi:Tetratricopeptide repeat
MQDRKLFRKLGIAVLLSGMFAFPVQTRPPQERSPASETAAESSSAPLTLDEVVRLIKQGKKDLHQVASAIVDRGVDFDLDKKTENKLRKVGADDQLLPEIWKVTPSGKAHMQALLTGPSGVEVQASAGEALAWQDIENEGEPNRRLRMADEFEKKFPSSPLLSYVYAKAAEAHQEKGDLDEAIAAARKSLKLDPNNTFSLIIVALALPQPRELQGSSNNEVRERLQEAESDANRALALLEKLKQRPAETDAQFQQRKGSLAADAHFALGMAETQQDHFEEALAQYRIAISSTSKPIFQYYYRLAEAYASLGQVSQAIDALQKASELARGTPMQKYAEDFMSELRQRAH